MIIGWSYIPHKKEEENVRFKKISHFLSLILFLGLMKEEFLKFYYWRFHSISYFGDTHN